MSKYNVAASMAVDSYSTLDNSWLISYDIFMCKKSFFRGVYG